MGKQRNILYLICFVLIFSGCATTSFIKSGDLGKSNIRNIVILGEHISTKVAQQYANKYKARTLYSTPTQSFLSDTVSNSVRGIIGPSRSMRDLIIELKSINHTSGEWVLIIPSLAERYFVVTLRNMDSGVLTNANASVYLIKGERNQTIETEVNRVSGGSLTVKYGDPSSGNGGRGQSTVGGQGKVKNGE